MARGQNGIFALGTSSHAHLEFDLLPGKEPAELLACWPASGSREPRSAG